MAGMKRLKETDEHLYLEIQKNSLFIDFFKSLYLLQSIHLCDFDKISVENIANFILKRFNLTEMTSTCAICQHECVLGGETGIKSNTCAHVFHVECYKHWLSYNVTCPLCRSNAFKHPVLSSY